MSARRMVLRLVAVLLGLYCVGSNAVASMIVVTLLMLRLCYGASDVVYNIEVVMLGLLRWL